MGRSTNVNENSCIHISKPGIDCDKEVCPSGTECCQEIGPNGVKANHITCCAIGSCNKEGKTGHCSKPSISPCPKMVEGYEDSNVSGSSEESKHNQILFGIGICILLLGISLMVFGTKK